MNANELADKSFMGLWDAYTSKKMECEDLEEKLRQQQSEIDSLEGEIFVKDAIRRSYREALEQIATGSIAGESNNYKATVYVMRQIALDALAILRKAQGNESITRSI